MAWIRSTIRLLQGIDALGVEPASIAKTLSVLQGKKPVLIVTEGTGNKKRLVDIHSTTNRVNNFKHSSSLQNQS